MAVTIDDAITLMEIGTLEEQQHAEHARTGDNGGHGDTHLSAPPGFNFSPVMSFTDVDDLRQDDEHAGNRDGVKLNGWGNHGVPRTSRLVRQPAAPPIG